MYLADIVPLELLDESIVLCDIKAVNHALLPLQILTYTRQAQYAGRWNDATRLCRGLVVESETGRIVARPFPKFFNVSEHGTMPYALPLPTEPFDVYEKLDGSLGIVFHYADTWHVASKGSFASEQANAAKAMLSRADLSLLSPGITYCVEILYPENRIVVDYGERRELVLLAGFNADGSELPLHEVSEHWMPIGPVVRRVPWDGDVAGLVNFCGTAGTAGTDEEGFVIRFASGVRAKAKHHDYVRLHKLMTGLTERDVWRACAYDDMAQWHMSSQQQRALAAALKCALKDIQSWRPGFAYAKLVEGIPDEMDAWTADIKTRLEIDYMNLTFKVLSVTSRLYGIQDRAEYARRVMEATDDKVVRSLCFASRDKKSLAPIIWRSLYPAAATPFRSVDGDS